METIHPSERIEIYPRTIARMLAEAMTDTPVVCLLGPRQSGKTTLARSLDPDRGYISLDEQNYLHLALEDPAGFIRGLPETVTLDEVQRAPGLLTEIKRAVDEKKQTTWAFSPDGIGQPSVFAACFGISGWTHGGSSSPSACRV